MRLAGDPAAEMLSGEHCAGDGRPLQQALKPTDPVALTCAVLLAFRWQRGRPKAEKLEKFGVDLPGIGLEVIKQNDMAPLATDNLEEVADILPEPSGLVII